LFSIIQAAGWPIWPLVACSILALALVIERFVSLKTVRVAPPKLLDEALAVSRASVPNADVVKQLEQNSALGEVLASGFRALNSDPRCSEVDLRAHMEHTGREVAHRLERYLSALATIASAAPLLGLRHCGRPVSRDGRPLVGAAPWVGGLWVLAGHGPWGISTGPGSARLLADRMLGRIDDAAIGADLGVDRFGAPRA